MNAKGRRPERRKFTVVFPRKLVAAADAGERMAEALEKAAAAARHLRERAEDDR